VIRLGLGPDPVCSLAIDPDITDLSGLVERRYFITSVLVLSNAVRIAPCHSMPMGIISGGVPNIPRRPAFRQSSEPHCPEQ
jgi:hypothetical protein